MRKASARAYVRVVAPLASTRTLLLNHQHRSNAINNSKMPPSSTALRLLRHSSVFPSFRASRRSLHLAPPWLLDDYIPRYHLISSIDAAKKQSLAYAHLRECNLCPRLCGVNRYEKTGVCLIGAETVSVNTIAPHFGEGAVTLCEYADC